MENPDQPYNKIPGPGVLQICQGWGSINSEGTWGFRASWLFREGLSCDMDGADTAEEGDSPEEQVCPRVGLSMDW